MAKYLIRSSVPIFEKLLHWEVLSFPDINYDNPELNCIENKIVHVLRSILVF